MSRHTENRRIETECINPTAVVHSSGNVSTKYSLCQGIECSSWKLLIWNGVTSGIDACACCGILTLGCGAFVAAVLAAELWGWMSAYGRVYMTLISPLLGV